MARRATVHWSGRHPAARHASPCVRSEATQTAAAPGSGMAWRVRGPASLGCRQAIPGCRLTKSGSGLARSCPGPAGAGLLAARWSTPPLGGKHAVTRLPALAQCCQAQCCQAPCYQAQCDQEPCDQTRRDPARRAAGTAFRPPGRRGRQRPPTSDQTVQDRQARPAREPRVGTHWAGQRHAGCSRAGQRTAAGCWLVSCWRAEHPPGAWSYLEPAPLHPGTGTSRNPRQRRCRSDQHRATCGWSVRAAADPW